MAIMKSSMLFIFVCFCIINIVCLSRHSKKLSHHKRHHPHTERKYQIYRDLKKKLDFIKKELIDTGAQSNKTNVQDSIAKYTKSVARTIKSKPLDTEEVIETDILVVHKDVIPTNHKHKRKRHRHNNVIGSKRKDILRPSDKLLNADEEVVVVVVNKTDRRSRVLSDKKRRVNLMPAKRGEIISEDVTGNGKELTSLDQTFSFSSEDDKEADQIHSAFTKENNEFLKEVRVESPDSTVKSSLPIINSFVTDKQKKTSLLEMTKPSRKHELSGQTKSHVNSTRHYKENSRTVNNKEKTIMKSNLPPPTNVNEDSEEELNAQLANKHEEKQKAVGKSSLSRSTNTNTKDSNPYNIVVNVGKNKGGKVLEITSNKAILETEQKFPDDDNTADISNLEAYQGVVKSKLHQPVEVNETESNLKGDSNENHSGDGPDEDYYEFTSESGFPSSKFKNSTKYMESESQDGKKLKHKNSDAHSFHTSNAGKDKEKAAFNIADENKINDEDEKEKVTSAKKTPKGFSNKKTGRKYPPSNPHPVADNLDIQPVGKSTYENITAKLRNAEAKSKNIDTKPLAQSNLKQPTAAYKSPLVVQSYIKQPTTAYFKSPSSPVVGANAVFKKEQPPTTSAYKPSPNYQTLTAQQNNAAYVKPIAWKETQQEINQHITAANIASNVGNIATNVQAIKPISPNLPVKQYKLVEVQSSPWKEISTVVALNSKPGASPSTVASQGISTNRQPQLLEGVNVNQATTNQIEKKPLKTTEGFIHEESENHKSGINLTQSIPSRNLSSALLPVTENENKNQILNATSISIKDQGSALQKSSNAENKVIQHILKQDSDVLQKAVREEPKVTANKPTNISVEAALKTLLNVPNLSIHITKNSSLSTPIKKKKKKKHTRTTKKVEQLEKIGFEKSGTKKSNAERHVEKKMKQEKVAVNEDKDLSKRNNKVRPEDIAEHEIVKESGIQGRSRNARKHDQKRDNSSPKHHRRDDAAGNDILKEIINGENTFQKYASHNGMSTRVDNSMIENSETNVEASPEEAANKIAGFGVNDERYGESWFEGQNHPIGAKPYHHHHKQDHDDYHDGRDDRDDRDDRDESVNGYSNENRSSKSSVNSLHGFEPDKEDKHKHVRDKTTQSKATSSELVRASQYEEGEKLTEDMEQKTSNIMSKICKNAECQNKDGTTDVDDDDLSQYVHGGDEIVAQVSIGSEGKSLSKFTKEQKNPMPILPEVNLASGKNGHSSLLQSIPANITATVEELKEVTADERDVKPRCQCDSPTKVVNRPGCLDYCKVVWRENLAFKKATHAITELENSGRINAKPDNKLFHHDSLEIKPSTKVLEASLLNPNPKPNPTILEKNLLPGLARAKFTGPVPEEKRLSAGFVRKLQIDKNVLEHVKNDIKHDPGISDALKYHLKQVADSITKAKIEKILAQPNPNKQLIGRNFHHHHNEPMGLDNQGGLSHLLGHDNSFSFHNSNDEDDISPIHVNEGSNPELVAKLLHRGHHHHHNPSMISASSLNRLLHHQNSEDVDDENEDQHEHEDSHGVIHMHGSSQFLNQLLHRNHGTNALKEEDEDEYDNEGGEHENFHDEGHDEDDDDEKAVISKGQLMKLLHQTDEGDSHHHGDEDSDDGDDEEYVDDDNDEHMMFADHNGFHSRYHHHHLLEPEAVHFTEHQDDLGINVSAIRTTPCSNGGLFLKLRHRKPQCVCPHQYYGKTCKSWNYCFPNPCDNGAQCVLVPEMPYHKCVCQKAYIGPTCKDFNPCDPNPCNNQGVCSHDGKTATCTCTSRFKGENCAELNNCYPDPCKNGGVCVDSGGKFKCNCKEGYVGDTCEGVSVCYSTNPCENGGTCVENGTSFSCVCTKGFLGNNCKDKVCAPNPCQNGGTCIQKENSAFACLCPPWSTGDTCGDISPCRMNPCKNGARCIDGMSGFRWTLKQMQYFCDCLPPFKGSHCEKNACSDCDHNAHCEIDRCVCNHNYYGNGRACRKLHLPVKSHKKCHPNPCKNDGVCFEKHDGGFGCKCKHEYLPPLCKERDPCKPNPCGQYGECIAIGQSIKCRCDEQYSGRYCNVIDPCKEIGLCANNGECVPTGNNTYGCKCAGRWSGLRCQDCSCPRSIDESIPSSQCDVNGACKCPESYIFNVVTGQCLAERKFPMPEVFGKSCRTNPCENGGQCIEEIGVAEESYKCICPEATYGKNCIYKNKCMPNPCLNGGSCLELDGRFLGCKCADGYHTPLCRKEMIPTTACKPSPCQNGASCIPHPNGGYDCICKVRFTGPHCTIDRCRDCDENARCEQGKCVCNDNYIGNGYECVKKTCPAPCLQFQTCIDSKCQCIPGHRQVSNICIPITDFTNSNYADPLPSDQARPVVTSVTQIHPSTKPSKPTTRPNIKPVAPTEKSNHTAATTSLATLAPTKSLVATTATTAATTATTAATAATTVTPLPSTTPILTTTTVASGNLSSQGTVFNKTMFSSDIKNATISLSNNTNSFPKNISSTNNADVKESTNTSSAVETTTEKVIKSTAKSDDKNNVNNTTSNDDEKKQPVLDVFESKSQSISSNSTNGETRLHAKQTASPISLAELKLGLTRLAAPVEQEKASISDGISGLDSTPTTKSMHHYSNSSLDAKPKKKKTKAEKYFEAKMRILSSYLRTHGKAKLNKVLDDIISQKRNHGKNKHTFKKNDSKKLKKDESLIIHVHTGTTTDLADLNAVLKRFTHNHNLASLTPDDIERMLEQHQAKIDQQAKKKQVKHTENTPMSVNVKINSNNVKEISGVMKHEISVQGHDESEKTQTVQVDQEGSAEEQEEERLAPQDGRDQQPGLEQAQDEMNEDITTENTVDDGGLQAEDALQTEDPVQNSFVSGSKKYQRPKQTGDVARNEETSNGFNKLTAEELAYYFNKNENKNNADDIEREMAAEKKHKEDVGIAKLFQTLSNGEESTTQLSALSHSPSVIDASSVTHPNNQTIQRIINSSADTGFLHQFFNNYNSDITTNGQKTDEFEDDDDATLQQLKEEQKNKMVSLTKQEQNLEVQTLKDAVEHHNQLNQQLRKNEIDNIEEEETNNEKLLEELKNKNMVKGDNNKMNHTVVEEKISEVELKEKRLKVLGEEKMKALKTLKEAQEKHNQMLREEELRKQDEKLKEESIRYLKEEKTKALKKLKEEQHQSDNVFEDDDEKEKEKHDVGVVQNQREDQQKQALKTLLEAQQRHKQEEIESEEKVEAEEIEKKYKEKYEKEKKIAFMKLQEEQKLERVKQKEIEEKERREKEKRRRRKKEEELKRRKEKEEKLKQEKEKERKIKNLQEEKLQAMKVLTEARLREQRMREQEKEQKKLVEKRLERIRLLHEQKEKESKAFEETKLKEKEKIRQEEEERQKMNIKILKEEREKSLQALRDAKLRQRNKTQADVRKEQYEKEKEENKEMLEEQRAEALTVLKKTRERQEALQLKEEQRQKEVQKSLEEQKSLVLKKQQEKNKKERTEEEKRRDEERKTENLKILQQLKKKEMEVLNEKEKERRAMEKQNATQQRLKEFQMAEKIKMAAHNDASTNHNSDKQEQDKMIAEIKEESMKVLREENKENKKEILKQQQQALRNMTQARTNRIKEKKKPLKTSIKAEVDEDEDEETSMEEQKLKNEKMIKELKQEAKLKDWNNLTLTKKTFNSNKSMEKVEVKDSYQAGKDENVGEGKRKALQDFTREPLNKFHGKQFKLQNALTSNKIIEKQSHAKGVQENFKEENKPQGEVHFPPMKDTFLRSKPMGSNVEKPTQIDRNLFEELKKQALNTLHERQKQWEEALEAKTKDEEQRGNKENVDFDKDVSIQGNTMQQNKDFSRNKLGEKSKNDVNGKDSRLNKDKKWNEILNSQAKDDKQNKRTDDLSNDINNTKVEQSTEGHLNGEIEENKNEHDVDINIKTLRQEKLKEKLRDKNDYSGVSTFENIKLEGTKMITGKGENTNLGGQKAQRVMPVISKVESLMIGRPKVENVMDQIRKEQIKEIQEKERTLQEKYLEKEKEQKVQEIHERQKLLDAKLLEKMKQQQYNALQEHLQKAKKEEELKKFLDENADTEESGSGEESENHDSAVNTPAKSELLKALSALNKFKNDSDESSSIERAVTPNKREHARSSNKFQTYVASLLQHRQQGINHDIAFRRSKEITYDEDRPHGLTFKRSKTAWYKHRNKTRSKRDN